MSEHQKKIENIYFDKYIKKNSIQERVKTKLKEIEKKFDELDEKLHIFKDIDRLGNKLIDDMNMARSEKWNDLSLEIILKNSSSEKFFIKYNWL